MQLKRILEICRIATVISSGYLFSPTSGWCQENSTGNIGGIILINPDVKFGLPNSSLKPWEFDPQANLGNYIRNGQYVGKVGNYFPTFPEFSVDCGGLWLAKRPVCLEVPDAFAMIVNSNDSELEIRYGASNSNKRDKIKAHQFLLISIPQDNTQQKIFIGVTDENQNEAIIVSKKIYYIDSADNNWRFSVLN